MSWLLYAGIALIAYKLLIPGDGDKDKAAKAKDKATKTKAKAGAAKRIDKQMSREQARELLGVSDDAGEEAIRKAYQAKVRQYHPDVVANAAPEIKALAEKRTKQLNAAYDRLIKS